MNRMCNLIKNGIVHEQDSFRAGKSCTSQLLNTTQHNIEYGFEKGEITGTIFVDFTDAYDTANYAILRKKIYEMTKDYSLTEIIEMLLKNGWFYVIPNGKKSELTNKSIFEQKIKLYYEISTYTL